MARHLSESARRFRGAPRADQANTPKRGRKRATNVSIDAEVLAQAKQLKLNLSQTLEDALRVALHEERIRRFEEENRTAFESYNRFIAKYGLWGEEYRNW